MAMRVPSDPRQEYHRAADGRRIAAHTPGLRGGCRCKACWARRWWTPERRAARSEVLRQQYAEGTRRVGRTGNDGRACRWTAEQDDALRSLVGQHDCQAIARLLTDRFGYARTEHAVKHRCQRLGLSRMLARPLSSSEVGRLFGLSREAVRSRFVAHGYLVGTLRRGGPHGMRMFERSEVERMVLKHPEAYELDLIRDPGLRALAISASRGRRLLGTREVAALTGVGVGTLPDWYAAGLVPSARFVRGVRPGNGGAWLIEAADLETVRRLAATRAERARVRSEKRRCPLTGAYLAEDEVPSPELRCAIRLVDRDSALARLAGAEG